MVKLGDDQLFSNIQEGPNAHATVYVIDKDDFHNDPVFLSLQVAHDKDTAGGLVSLVRGRSIESNSALFSVYETFDKITGSQLASFGYVIHGIDKDSYFKYSVCGESSKGKDAPKLVKNVLRKFWTRHKEKPPTDRDIEDLYSGKNEYPWVKDEHHDKLVKFICTQTNKKEDEVVVLVVCCQEFMVSAMKGALVIAKNSMRESTSFVGYKKPVMIFDAYNPLIADSCHDSFEESVELHKKLSDQEKLKNKFDRYVKENNLDKCTLRSPVLSEMIYHTKILNNALLFDQIDIPQVVLLANLPFTDSCKIDNYVFKDLKKSVYTDPKEFMDEISPTLCMTNFYKALLDPKDIIDQRYEYWESSQNVRKELEKQCKDTNLNDVIKEMIRHEQCCMAVHSLSGLRSIGSCMNTVVKKYASSHQIKDDIRKINVHGLSDVDKQARLKSPHLNAFNEKVGQMYERGHWVSSLSLAERIAKVFVSPHMVSMHLDMLEIFSRDDETIVNRICPKCVQLNQLQERNEFCSCTYLPTMISKLNIDTKKEDQIHFGDTLLTGIISSNFSIFGDLEKPAGHTQDRHGSGNENGDDEDDYKNMIKKQPYYIFRSEMDSLDNACKSEIDQMIKPKLRLDNHFESRILESLSKQNKIPTSSQSSYLTKQDTAKQDSKQLLDALMVGYNTVIRAYKSYISHVSRVQISKNSRQQSSVKININPLSYSPFGPIVTRIAECSLAYLCANSGYEFLAKSVLPIKRQQKNGVGLELDELKSLRRRVTIPEEAYIACALKSSPIDNVSMKVGTFKAGKSAVTTKQNDSINGRSAIRSATVKVKMLMPEINESRRQKSDLLMDRSSRIDLNAIAKMALNSCQGPLDSEACQQEDESCANQVPSPIDIISLNEEIACNTRYMHTSNPLDAFDDLDVMNKKVPAELMNLFRSFINYPFDEDNEMIKKKRILVAQNATLGEKIKVLKGTVLGAPDHLILILRLATILNKREIPGGECACSVEDFLGYLFHLLVTDFIKKKDEYFDRKFLCPLVFEIKGAYSDLERKMYPQAQNRLCPVLNLNRQNLATFRVAHFNFSAADKYVHRTNLTSLSHEDISYMCSFNRSYTKSAYTLPTGKSVNNVDSMQLLKTLNHSKTKFDSPNKIIMINSTSMTDLYLKHKTGQGRPKEQLESCVSKRQELINYLDGLECIDESEMSSRISRYIRSEHADIEDDILDEVLISLLEDSSVFLLYEIENKDKSILLELIKNELLNEPPMKKRKYNFKVSG